VEPDVRILIVDDDPHLLQALAHILEKEGYEVIQASNGKDALRLSQEQKPDLILLDVVLPDTDGASVCKQIKTSQATANIFVVLLSAIKTAPESRAVGLETGADGYIVRPISNRELLARLRLLLRLKQEEDHLRRQADELTNANRELQAEIQERKQMQDERDRILNLSQDLICIAGMDGFFKYVNPAWMKILGYSREELLAQPFSDFIHPDDHANNDAEVQKLAAGQPTIDFENRYIHKDGSFRTISWTATALPDEKLLYCIGRDISVHKSTLQTLQESERKFHSLFMEMDEGVALHRMVYDAQGNGIDFILVDVNPAYEKHVGLVREKIVGKKISEIFGFTPYLETYAGVVSSGQPAYFETYFKALDRYFSISAFPFGEEHFATVFRNITERKVEEERLRASEERFMRIFEANPSAIAILTRHEGRVIDVNQTLLDLLGYSRSEIIGKTVETLNIWTDPRTYQTLDQMVTNNATVQNFETRWHKKNREAIDVILSIAPIHLSGEDCLLGMAIDLSQLIQAERAREGLLAHLRSLSQKLVSVQEEERQWLSHELNENTSQALTAAVINLEMLRSELPPERDALRKRIDQSIFMIYETIDQVRFLGRDLRPPALDTLGLNVTLEGYCAEFSRRANIKINYQGQDSLPLSEAAKITFYRLLQEGLSNIARHAQASKAAISLQNSGHAVQLTIEDNGRGFQLSKGLGHTKQLGLIGMKERFGLLGGHLEIESHPDKGTRLVGILPATET
jgi:PAS domain S-box-containing protein